MRTRLNLANPTPTSAALWKDFPLPERILVIDDHPLVLNAMTIMLKALQHGCDVDPHSSGESALRQNDEATALRLILMDFNLPGITGNAAIQTFRKRFPETPIIVISGDDDRRVIKAALAAGANAYVSKGADAATIQGLINRALNNTLSAEEWLAPAPKIERSKTKDYRLTPKQSEILGLMTKGMSNKEIAFRMGSAEVTVKMHISAIFRALGVRNRTQAVLAARSLGLTGNTESS